MLGTQPWPIGRYGSCELMIGCIAKAKNYEVFVNTKEMEDVQWYDKHELVAAVKMYAEAEGSNYAETQRNCWSQLGFFIPPPFAVAHHLIRTWALKDSTWFTPKPRTSL
jgi:NAD+ diphosphatase